MGSQIWLELADPPIPIIVMHISLHTISSMLEVIFISIEDLLTKPSTLPGTDSSGPDPSYQLMNWMHTTLGYQGIHALTTWAQEMGVPLSAPTKVVIEEGILCFQTKQ